MQTSAHPPVTITQPELAAAFTEWDRRYREEPTRFMNEAERLLKETPETYGEACAPYLLKIIEELRNTETTSVRLPYSKEFVSCSAPDADKDDVLRVHPAFGGTTNESAYGPRAMAACSGCARSSNAPTVVLMGPQGCGKTTHAQAFAQAFGCTHVIDGESLNGFDVDDPKAIPRDGALIISPECAAGYPRADLVIEARTKAGFDKAVSLLPSSA